jgi:MFS family permease
MASRNPVEVSQPSTRPLKAVLWSVFLLRTGHSAGAVLVGSYLASLERQGFHVSAIIVALLLSSAYGLELFVAPLMGSLSDRFGRKPFILAGPLIGLVALNLYPLSTGLPLLFGARLMEGLAAATLTPATLGFLADQTSVAGRRGKTMAYFEIATLIGIGSGYTIGGPLWQQLQGNGFRLAGVLYLASATVVAVAMTRTLQVARAERTKLRDYVRLIRQPRILEFAPAWLAVTAIVGLVFNNIVFQLSGPHHAGQRLTGGMSGTEVSAIMGGFTLAIILGTFGWSRVFGKFPRRSGIMLVALVGMFTICLILLVLNHSPAESRLPVAILLPELVVAIGLQSGFTPAALAYLADIAEEFPVDRGAIMGLYSIFLSVGAVVGGVAGGPFAQRWGLDGIIFMTIVLSTLSLVTVLRLRRHEAPRAIGQALASPAV